MLRGVYYVKEVHKLVKVPKGADKVLISWNRFKEFLLRNYKRTHFKVSLVRGEYDYYHYLCDGTDDRGWGCGYRTLQTMLSWLNMKQGKGNVPSIRAIQECLVNVGDKPANFVGSRDWIGSVEVSITIDSLCDVPCRILHVRSGELSSVFVQISQHFTNTGCPIMMGGDRDASSKGVFGACSLDDQGYLLIVDPHHVSSTGCSASQLVSEGWVKWVSIEQFNQDSFYNLCLPQVKWPFLTSHLVT